MTSTSVDLSTTMLRITMFEPDFPPTLAEFSDIFTNVESLVFVGSVLATIDPHNLGQRPEPDRLTGFRTSPGGPYLVSPNVLTSAQGVADSFRIVRVTYQSPVDVFLQAGGTVGTLSTIGGMAYLAMRGVLSLFKQAAEVRKAHSEASLFASDTALQIEINKRLRERLNVYPGSNLDRIDPDEFERRAIRKPLSERLDEASKALIAAEAITVEQA